MLLTIDHAFPHLDEEDMRLLEPFGTCDGFEDGEIVFKAGDPGKDMLVVKSGLLEILNPFDSDRLITTHGPRQFSGDIDLLIRRPILVTGRAKGKTRVLRIASVRLHEVLIKVPKLSDKLLTAFQMRRDLLMSLPKIGLSVVGHPRCRETTLLREFLFRNFVPFTYYNPDTPEGAEALEELGNPTDFPVVRCLSNNLLVRPTLLELAQEAGIWHHCPSQSVDLAVIGGGPAGITAAVYAASEGLNTIVIERLGPGGQASGSSKIENFMGFPAGLSGAELSMRGVLQMLKFGAKLVAPAVVKAIEPATEKNGNHALVLDCGAKILAKVVIVSTGVTWRKLEATNADYYERAGIYYACTSVEALLHDTEDVIVVGAGNSAGQAATFLADCCRSRTVHILARGAFGPSMSDYLKQRCESTANIVIHENTKITCVNGDNQIRSVDTLSNGVEGKLDAGAIFVFIGADPGGDCLPDAVERDELGYVLTGTELICSDKWPLHDREPCPLETSVPGILAAGDLRSGSTKRVGFAVGDGSMAVTCVHRLLAQI